MNRAIIYGLALIIITLQLLTLYSVRHPVPVELTQEPTNGTNIELRQIQESSDAASERSFMTYTASRFILTALQEIKDEIRLLQNQHIRMQQNTFTP